MARQRHSRGKPEAVVLYALIDELDGANLHGRLIALCGSSLDKHYQTARSR
jgi:hypothetical protein